MIRFGIVGFGLHAVKRLIPGFGPARNCRVSALSRRDLNRARETAAQYGIPHGFASAAELCSSPEVDAVFVASPDALHLRDVLTAIQCGKPVLCEKPMAMNPAECQQMVAAARAAGVLLGVAHVFRFEDSTARLRDRVAAGQVGRPVFARAEFCYSGRQHPRAWLTDPTLACGGPIADVGVHCIDALRYILQDEVVRVTARSLHDQGSGAVEAAASLTLEFLSGTLGTVMVSTRAEYRTPIEIVGESGVLRADDGLNVDRPISLQWWRNGAVVETEVVSNHLAYTHQVEAFAAAIEGKGIFPATGEEGWQNQEILDSAYRSTRSGVAEDVRRIKGLDL